ncbi:MAG: sugar phosphate isomerase/epimerase family protein [Planctomycetota bacterium]|nr:sugar phosphate isomerase/epimerase family protein [Planctomycetota bacterium]MEE3283470.1 sugar phosphate isomerase/epimerase family protein [Planctomycetota bacterium]MEE3366376.1 sugar phosphate isomerase/epimerase family protein [Planctomycetota bacterium]
MTTNLLTSRRNFLAGGLAAGIASATVSEPTVSLAAKPPGRNGKSHMKLSLAGYSFNRLLPKRPTPEQEKSAKMTMDGFIRFCADQDLDGIEPTTYYFPKTVTQEYLVNMKELSFRLGLDISGTAIGNDFCVAEGAGREKQLADARQWIDHAAVLGAPAIRIFAGRVPKGDTEAVAIERCIAGINQVLDHAEKRGVFLALENHGGITSTPAQMMRIIKGVRDSRFFGVNLDGGNFRTDDPYRDMAVIAPYAVNAQVKVSIFRGDKKEPADLERVIKILRDADYRGYVVLEYEESDPLGEIPGYLKQLRQLIS